MAKSLEDAARTFHDVGEQHRRRDERSEYLEVATDSDVIRSKHYENALSTGEFQGRTETEVERLMDAYEQGYRGEPFEWPGDPQPVPERYRITGDDSDEDNGSGIGRSMTIGVGSFLLGLLVGAASRE